MIKQWQFNLAFLVAIALLVFFSVGPTFGVASNPSTLVIGGFGILMGYIFTRRDKLTNKTDEDEETPKDDNGPDKE